MAALLVFFDDILIYSTSMTNHIQHLTIVLQLLQTHQFFVKESKCNFATPTVTYLGHIIQQGTVSPDPEKIQAILQWPEPKSFTMMRAFLGITGFYRKFTTHGFTQIESFYMESKCQHNIYTVQKYHNYTPSFAPP